MYKLHCSGILEDNTHTGFLIDFENKTSSISTSFLTKGTTFLTSFEMRSPNLDCLVFIDLELDTNILCIGDDDQYYLHQNITNDKAFMVSKH